MTTWILDNRIRKLGVSERRKGSRREGGATERLQEGFAWQSQQQHQQEHQQQQHLQGVQEQQRFARFVFYG